MGQRHTFAGSGEPPSEIQRGLDDYDRDTIAYLSQVGVSDIQLQRVTAMNGGKNWQDLRVPGVHPRRDVVQ